MSKKRKRSKDAGRTAAKVKSEKRQKRKAKGGKGAR